MATIQDSVAKAEGLSAKEKKRLEKLLDEIEKANPSMPPQIYQPDETIQIDTARGGESIDGSVIGNAGMKELKNLAKKFDDAGSSEKKIKIEEKIYNIIGMYVGSGPHPTLYSIEIEKGGWIGHLSMPGYMDQTEPGHYKSLKAAIEDLHSMYAE